MSATSSDASQIASGGIVLMLTVQLAPLQVLGVLTTSKRTSRHSGCLPKAAATRACNSLMVAGILSGAMSRSIALPVARRNLAARAANTYRHGKKCLSSVNGSLIREPALPKAREGASETPSERGSFAWRAFRRRVRSRHLVRLSSASTSSMVANSVSTAWRTSV